VGLRSEGYPSEGSRRHDRIAMEYGIKENISTVKLESVVETADLM